MFIKADRKAQYAAYVKTCINSGEHIQTFVEFSEMMDAIDEEMQDVEDEEVTQVMFEVNNAILGERIRQNRKWGKQRHENGAWLAILVEEVGEAAQAMQQGSVASKETDANNLYEELLHASAVAAAWAEQILEENPTIG